MEKMQHGFPSAEDMQEAHEKAQKIAKAFVDNCVQKELTIFELGFVQRAISKEIANKISQMEFKTKLS